MRRIAGMVLGIWMILGMAGCSLKNPESQQEQVNFFGMDTYMTITAYGERAGQALEQAQKRIEGLEKEWSVTDENSEIYQANHSNGSPVTHSEDTKEVVEFALHMA